VKNKLSYLSHDIFLRSLKVKGTIIAKSRIHFGAGRDVTSFQDADSILCKILYNGDDHPYIPGSSLKGVFRNACESILESSGLEACDINNRQSICSQTGTNLLELAQIGDIENLKKELKSFCWACKIFGGTNFNSHIYFLDAIPISTDSIATDIAPGIAINRRDGTTIQGSLFKFEYIVPNSTFSFECTIKNLPNFLIGLFFNTISLINKKLILVGGKKRAGLGQIFILLDELEYISISESENFNLSFKSIKKLKSDITISKLESDLENEDYPVSISLDSIKSMSKEEFNDYLIKKFIEVWNLYVRN